MTVCKSSEWFLFFLNVLTYTHRGKNSYLVLFVNIFLIYNLHDGKLAFLCVYLVYNVHPDWFSLRPWTLVMFFRNIFAKKKRFGSVNICLGSNQRCCISSLWIERVSAQADARRLVWWEGSGPRSNWFQGTWSFFSNFFFLLFYQTFHDPWDSKFLLYLFRVK